MKTPTQQTHEDAVAGGWTGYTRFTDEKENAARLIAEQEDLTAWALLQPDYWQAVGRQRGWEQGYCEDAARGYDKGEWHKQLTAFIDHRADGLSIDDALAAISQAV